MATYVGDTATELFVRSAGAGETFTRLESAIDGVDTTFVLTFTDLGAGIYQYEYVPSVTGMHSWVGSGDQGGTLTISFDVDALTETVITIPATTIVSANQSIGGAGGPRPAIIDDLVIYQGEHWYWPMQLYADDGTIADTTGWNAQFTVRATAEGGQAFFASVDNSRIFVGYDPPKRTNSTAYTTGSFVVPSTLNGYIYKATTGGTTAGSAPTWPTTISQTVVDGTVTWTCVYTDAEYVTNLRIELQPSDTDDVAEWGTGRFDLEVTDTFSKQARIVEGNCMLSRAITRPAS